MVVVTGATGHLGTVLVQTLVNSGEAVRYVARAGSRAQGLEGIRAERVEADLFDVEALARAFSGASVVYHSAGRISIVPGDDLELHRVNVEGTRSVIEAARRAGVGRLVNVSSIEAFPIEYGPYPITESHGWDPDRTMMAYGRTKALGMQAALEAGRDGLDVVVCCPTAFLGPPDYRSSPVGLFVRDYLRRRLPAYVSGGFDFADVRDIAAGLILAARRGAPGSVYLLPGSYVTIPDILHTLEEMTGVPKPRVCLPSAAALPLMPLVEAYYRLSGRPPRFTRYSLKILTLGATVDGSRARRELGYTTRPLQATLGDLVNWYRENDVPRE